MAFTELFRKILFESNFSTPSTILNFYWSIQFLLLLAKVVIEAFLNDLYSMKGHKSAAKKQFGLLHWIAKTNNA